MLQQCKRNGIQSQRVFTLVELLVVIAIIAVLAGLLLPALDKALSQATLISCSSTQRQAYLSLQSYGMDYGEYPSTYSRTAAIQSTGEHAGRGFHGFSTDGPYRLLFKGKYAGSWQNLQCQTRIGVSMPTFRAGWMTACNGEYGSGQWFNYNGPTASTFAMIGYSHNLGNLYTLGGHPGNPG